MGTLYAMSDIHGFYDLMLRNLEYLDLSEPGTRLIFCGDYVDGGTDGCRVLYKIKELTERYPLQVVALKGNHETMFLDFLEAGELDIVNVAWAAIQLTDAIGYNFLSATCREKLRDFDFPTDDLDVLFRAARIVQKDILENHKDLVQWMKHLPYYYETETQIFVHAGINEEAGNRWKQATSEMILSINIPLPSENFIRILLPDILPPAPCRRSGLSWCFGTNRATIILTEPQESATAFPC